MEGNINGVPTKFLVVVPTPKATDLLALVAKAHQVCPYSNATRGNIPVTLETTVA